jgi:hypothetical protein
MFNVLSYTECLSNESKIDLGGIIRRNSRCRIRFTVEIPTLTISNDSTMNRNEPSIGLFGRFYHGLLPSVRGGPREVYRLKVFHEMCNERIICHDIHSEILPILVPLYLILARMSAHWKRGVNLNGFDVGLVCGDKHANVSVRRSRRDCVSLFPLWGFHMKMPSQALVHVYNL